MKKNLLKISCLLFMLLTAVSCKDALEDVLSKEVKMKRTVTFDVKPKESVSAEIPETRVGSVEEVLYDDVLNVNIAQEMEKQGFSFKNVKNFLITQGTLEEAIPSEVDMQDFVGAKLYFENRDQLVAKAERLEGRKVRFTIVNGNLLDKLKDDKLHIILVGTRPIRFVRLKLTMDYSVKVSLIK